MISDNEGYQAILASICTKCIDGDRAGGCRLSADRTCAAREFRLEIPAVIESVKSDLFEPYIDALRTGVCSVCRWQNEQKYCQLRDNLDCGLDRYFPILVEGIEQVQVSGNMRQR